MALTNDQIERYSRQIIAPGFGGAAQQRMLGARVLLAADSAVAGSMLAYLVGAGVGTIDLMVEGDAPALGLIVGRMRDLNSDVAVRIVDTPPARFDLALIVATTARMLERAAAIAAFGDGSPAWATVFVRLDRPARIAVIAARPPCLRCADAGALLAPLEEPAEEIDFVASVAAAEAIKLLAGYGTPPPPTIIEFRGYAATARPLAAAAPAASTGSATSTASTAACRCAALTMCPA
ncbi:MAG: hypothetical protein IVW56_12305 [Candidatus Binataceae bacterium]|nr:hypothetical protein [Candidatus Binataceae bacterium]